MKKNKAHKEGRAAELMMSLREWPAKRVFALKDKLAEFRTTWPKGFEGRVNVYGSGPGGAHAVIGSFKAGRAMFVAAGEELPDSVVDWILALEDSGTPESSVSALIEEVANEHAAAEEDGIKGFHVIPIADARELPRPVPLSSFKGRDGRPLKRPPQSWIYVAAEEPPKE